MIGLDFFMGLFWKHRNRGNLLDRSGTRRSPRQGLIPVEDDGEADGFPAVLGFGIIGRQPRAIKPCQWSRVAERPGTYLARISRVLPSRRPPDESLNEERLHEV